MSWFRHPQIADDGARFDAVLAENIAAQKQLGRAADQVTQMADETREHVEAAIGGFKDRTDNRLKTRNQTLEQLLARDL